MPELTDRYVNATLKSIPEKQRADIDAELRTSIADAVEDRMSEGLEPESAEAAVLNEMGDPDRLAAGFAGQPGYLIGPEHFFSYKRLLTTLLLTAVPAVAVVLGVLEVVGGGSLGDAFARAIGIGLTLLVQVTFWTTLVFYIIERTDSRDAVPVWSVDQLPASPTPSTIKLGETIASVVFLVLAIAILLVSGDLAPIQTEAGVPIPFFDPGLDLFWIPYFVVVLAVEIIFEFVKYRVGRWTWPLAIVNIGLNALFTIPAVYLLRTDQVLNPNFWQEIGWGAAPGPDSWTINIVVASIVLVALWDIWEGIRGARK